jgi:hypothetical protein
MRYEECVQQFRRKVTVPIPSQTDLIYMKFKHLLLLPAFALTTQAATVTYNDSITAIFGSGNPNGGWVSVLDNNIELGLRAKNRVTAATTNDGAGNYSMPTGFNGTRAMWNFEFSMNSNADGGPGANLSAYRFVLSFDVDPSQGQSWNTMNPLTLDNSYGNDTTANGAGVEPTDVPSALALIAGNSIAQNSGNIVFSGSYPGFPSPLTDATYDFMLTAYSSTDTAGVTPLAQASMRVTVGQGGAAVPDAGSTLLLLGSALTGMACFKGWKRRQASK